MVVLICVFTNGNRKLGRILPKNLPIWAMRFNPDLKAKYQAIIKAGKPPKVALTALMRKLIELANALIKANRLWVINTLDQDGYSKVASATQNPISTGVLGSYAISSKDCPASRCMVRRIFRSSSSIRTSIRFFLSLGNILTDLLHKTNNCPFQPDEWCNPWNYILY